VGSIPSAVVALMSQSTSDPIRTFAIGFEDNSYNEIHYARRIAKQFQTLHHEEIIHPDIFQLIDQLVAHFDEPFADSSIFPTYLVSKMAANQVKLSYQVTAAMKCSVVMIPTWRIVWSTITTV
jgi:asparagine synthase (glutamine-hydrolysing)